MNFLAETRGKREPHSNAILSTRAENDPQI
jgi:hypothetical protein